MKFSVIIPVFNKANTITDSINTVLAQTEKDFELIIVNDGSTDHLADVLKDFPDVKVINRENGGVSRARNAGIRAAEGDYICFLDADDLWTPDHLSELRHLIEAYPSAAMFATSHTETTSDGKVYHSSTHLADLAERFLAENLFKLLNTRAYTLINTNSICISKAFLLAKDLFFEPDEKIGEDTDMWYRVALHTPVAFSKKETTVYRRENSTATKHGSGSFTWIFCKRWETLRHGDYDAERKAECGKLIDRYRLSCSRSYMLQKDRKNAKKMLKCVTYHDKRYFLTYLLTCLPFFVSKKLLK